MNTFFVEKVLRLLIIVLKTCLCRELGTDSPLFEEFVDEIKRKMFATKTFFETRSLSLDAPKIKNIPWIVLKLFLSQHGKRRSHTEKS